MRILFMGTPDIAAASLQELLDVGYDICGVFTRADKPVGRKQVLTAPPVKQLAQKYDIPVYQPATLRDGKAEKIIRELAPDLCVVVAYGRLLPPEILSIPRYGCINLHVSLLPKYRGSAPVQWAVLNGDRQTGVSIMYLDEGLDTGDVLKVAPVEIGENETSGELFEKVTAVGAKTLVEAIREIESGTAVATPQDHSQATLAPMLKKEMAEFSFNRPAQQLHNLVRGMNPWPMAYFLHEGKKVKVTTSRMANGEGKAGTVLSLKPLVVACEQGALELTEVVPEGKRPMEGAAWAAGRRFKVGDCLNGENNE